jgi:hypothetical protein
LVAKLFGRFRAIIMGGRHVVGLGYCALESGTQSNHQP